MQTTVEELRALGDAGATIINVGSRAGRREIRGAVRYRPHDLLAEHVAPPIPLDRPVVLYDENGKGRQTEEIAQKLAAEGFDVRVLTGGFDAWERAGGLTQEASFEQIVTPTAPDEVQELDRRI
jgi:rhodanese-related sulfurtransferase